MSERLKSDYVNKIRPELMNRESYRNPYEVPKLTKIVINQGLGEALQNTKVLDHAHRELAVITGQKGVVTRSKRAIASWKLRAKVPVGLTVVLRGPRMYAFLDRLIHLALPRIRDFQGIDPKSFDRHGNYSFGLEEQLMFPEIVYDKVDAVRGMNVTLVTSARDDREALGLLRAFGLPYRDNPDPNPTL